MKLALLLKNTACSQVTRYFTSSAVTETSPCLYWTTAVRHGLNSLHILSLEAVGHKAGKTLLG